MSQSSASLRARDARQAAARLLGTPVADDMRTILLGDVDPATAWPARHLPIPATDERHSFAQHTASWSDEDTLLSEIVARTASVAVPIIQFCAVGSARSGTVARAVAAAAAGRLGRTLLVEAPGEGLGHANTVEGFKHVRHQAGVSADDFTPDCDRLGLYHARIASFSYGEREPARSPLHMVIDRAGSRFRLLILDCAAPAYCPDTISLSGHCSGSILVVEAGRSRLADIQAAMRLLESGRATLFGTVLEIPSTLQQRERRTPS